MKDMGVATGPPNDAILFLSIAAIIIATVGCNGATSKRVEVSGQVTFKDNPIEDGTIQFRPIDVNETVPIEVSIVNGEYRFEQDSGVPIGKYRVAIQAFQRTGRMVPDLTSIDRNKPNQELIEHKIPLLPEEFNERSTLEIEITGEMTEKNFDL